MMRLLLMASAALAWPWTDYAHAPTIVGPSCAEFMVGDPPPTDEEWDEIEAAGMDVNCAKLAVGHAAALWEHVAVVTVRPGSRQALADEFRRSDFAVSFRDVTGPAGASLEATIRWGRCEGKIL